MHACVRAYMRACVSIIETVCICKCFVICYITGFLKFFFRIHICMQTQINFQWVSILALDKTCTRRNTGTYADMSGFASTRVGRHTQARTHTRKHTCAYKQNPVPPLIPHMPLMKKPGDISRFFKQIIFLNFRGLPYTCFTEESNIRQNGRNIILAISTEGRY